MGMRMRIVLTPSTMTITINENIIVNVSVVAADRAIYTKAANEDANMDTNAIVAQPNTADRNHNMIKVENEIDQDHNHDHVTGHQILDIEVVVVIIVVAVENTVAIIV